MRVLVLSDSHGNISSIRTAICVVSDVDCYIHLGDVAGDACILSGMTQLPVYAVRGNCDFGLTFKTEEVLTLGEVRIFATHGHHYGVKTGIDQLATRAQQLGCGLALYGHTHASSVEAHGSLLIVNPGSTSQPRMGRKRSVALLVIEGRDVFPRIITF